jgi:threonine/homoserine/homoserine lactone efflux protein
MVFAVVVSLGTRGLGRAFERTVALERWLRRSTGVVFIAVGIYLSLENIFGVFG